MVLVHLYPFPCLCFYILFFILSDFDFLLTSVSKRGFCFHDPLRKIFRLYSQIDFRPLFPFHRFFFTARISSIFFPVFTSRR